MIKIKILAWLAFALSLPGCKTYETGQLPPTQLRFGSGGGFTGAVTEYLLLENGQVFLREGLEGNFQSLGKIRKNKAKALYKSWEANAFSDKEFQHPGNIYYFVTMIRDGKEHRLSWGSDDHPAGEALQAFFKACNAAIKEVKSGS